MRLCPSFVQPQSLNDLVFVPLRPRKCLEFEYDARLRKGKLVYGDDEKGRGRGRLEDCKRSISLSRGTFCSYAPLLLLAQYWNMIKVTVTRSLAQICPVTPSYALRSCVATLGIWSSSIVTIPDVCFLQCYAGEDGFQLFSMQ